MVSNITRNPQGIEFRFGESEERVPVITFQKLGKQEGHSSLPLFDDVRAYLSDKPRRRRVTDPNKMVPRLDLRHSVLCEISRLADLPENWDGYGAPALDRAIIDAARLLAWYLPTNAPAPKVTPMSPGNLQFEWHAAGRSLELELETPTTVRYLKWEPTAGTQEEGEYPAADTLRTADLVLRWFAAKG